MELDEKKIVRSQAAVCSNIESTVYVLNLKSNDYLKLNATASFIWEILKNKTSYKELSEKCNKAFAGFNEFHLKEFLLEAAKKGIVEIHET